MDCIFCKIVNGEMPSYKIYEDEFTYAFLDVAPGIDGHTLVIPKKHCRNIADCDEETLSQVMTAVKNVGKHYMSIGYDGFNVLNANEPCAQQSVFHLHFHVVPRKNEDGLDAFPKLDRAKTPLEEVWKKLKMD